MVGGAWGGRSDKDGIEAITNPSQNLSNTPVEVLELHHPVRDEEYALVPDSGGPGRNRGGLGISRSFRVLADEALLHLRSARMHFAPYRLEGGGPAPPNRPPPTHAEQTVEALRGQVHRVSSARVIAREVP